jgi:hypothetical protein
MAAIILSCCAPGSGAASVSRIVLRVQERASVKARTLPSAGICRLCNMQRFAMLLLCGGDALSYANTSVEGHMPCQPCAQNAQVFDPHKGRQPVSNNARGDMRQSLALFAQPCLLCQELHAVAVSLQAEVEAAQLVTTE